MASKLLPLRITITGGAKSGKTTIMKNVAKDLGIYAFSTGDLFRCYAWVWANSKKNILDLETRKTEIKKAYIHFYNNNYYYKKNNITKLINTNEMSTITCQLAQLPWFRKIVKKRIAKIICKHRQIIVEGRDTGTKILPDAEIKIYLSHNYDSRVENISGSKKDKEILKDLLIWRDNQDANRLIDPFIMPKNAIVFDNSYIRKEMASKLLLERIILPILISKKISTKKFDAESVVNSVVDNDLAPVSVVSNPTTVIHNELLNPNNVIPNDIAKQSKPSFKFNTKKASVKKQVSKSNNFPIPKLSEFNVTIDNEVAVKDEETKK